MGELTSRYIKKQRDYSQLNERPPFPRILKIDVCNICNYSCIFCPQAKHVGKKGNIDEELCMKIIEDAYYAGAREICLSSTGEPLLNKKLPEYIRFSKKMGYEYIFFNTNGLLMAEKLGEDLLISGVDSVKFSINGAEKYYELVHGVDSYQTVIDNLKCFDMLRKNLKSPCKLYVSYVATKYTYDEADKVKTDTEQYCDEIMVMNANNRGGVVDEVDNELYLGDDEFSYQFPCSQIFNNAYVTSEGYLVACCQDFENNMVMADLNKMSISDAWNCDRFVAFRGKFLKHEFEGLLCDNCLNGTHNPITPIDYDKAGYQHSDIRRNYIKERIEKLSNMWR